MTRKLSVGKERKLGKKDRRRESERGNEQQESNQKKREIGGDIKSKGGLLGDSMQSEG